MWPNIFHGYLVPPPICPELNFGHQVHEEKTEIISQKQEKKATYVQF